jgi:damage-control phosphatase, subfamily II, stand-alone protein
MAPFCKLADLGRYVACSWDLTTDGAGRQYWVSFFKRHLDTMLSQAGATDAPACRAEFFARFDAFTADPASHGRVSILTLDQWRDDILRKYGFVDPFFNLKNRENAKALPLLPRVCRELDSLAGAEQLRAIILGVFAGNIFDMGAGATAAKFLTSGPDFYQTRGMIPPHPWLIDDYDSLEWRMLKGRLHHKAVFFVDNAGSDFLLGAVPMMRWLAQRGTRVVLAANSRPTLNDMTIDEVNSWWPKIIEAEPSLGTLPIERVATGTGEPLIDLSQVSEQLNSAAADADLVILEGMGRGVESNLDARFSCDALNVAMIKDEAVAARHGGKVFDVVCRFQPLH